MTEVLRDFPHHIETARLTIRSPLPGDGAELNTAVCESINELRPWMPWAQTMPTLEESETNVRKGHARFLLREELWLLLFLKGTHTLVGCSGLHDIDWSIPRFETGYWVRTRYASQGYITEAVMAITTFAFDTLGARRLCIACDATNSRSAAVARRAGFVHEGTFACDHRCPMTGELRDTLLFAKVRRDEHPIARTGAKE